MRIIPGFYSDQSERSLALDLTQAWPGSGHVMMRHGCYEWEAESSEGPSSWDRAYSPGSSDNQRCWDMTRQAIAWAWAPNRGSATCKTWVQASVTGWLQGLEPDIDHCHCQELYYTDVRAWSERGRVARVSHHTNSHDFRDRGLAGVIVRERRGLMCRNTNRRDVTL